MEGTQRMHLGCIIRRCHSRNPGLLGLMGTQGQSSLEGSAGHKLKIRKLTRKEWASKTTEMNDVLVQSADRMKAADERLNLVRYLDLIVGGIYSIFQEKRRAKRAKQSGAERNNRPAFRGFRQRHIEHP